MNKKAAHLRELDAKVWNSMFNSFAMSIPFLIYFLKNYHLFSIVTVL